MELIAKPHCCMNCGARWPDPTASWPRECGACHHRSFKNPTPVAVVIVWTEEGEVLTVRRNIPPAIGELGLPGGFVNFGESCPDAAVRELREEAGVILAASDVRLLDVKHGGHVTLIFYAATRPVRKEDVSDVPNPEVQEVVWTKEPIPLCFPTHTAALAEWFGRAIGSR